MEGEEKGSFFPFLALFEEFKAFEFCSGFCWKFGKIFVLE